jgi:hypothetical protein
MHMASERVTVTLPQELLEEIDRCGRKAEEGLVEWGEGLPPDDDGLLDGFAGRPVAWVEGKGWSGGPA